MSKNKFARLQKLAFEHNCSLEHTAVEAHFLNTKNSILLRVGLLVITIF
jgi:hypothetical protein